jgi:hypothetical protein
VPKGVQWFAGHSLGNIARQISGHPSPAGPAAAKHVTYALAYVVEGRPDGSGPPAPVACLG